MHDALPQALELKKFSVPLLLVRFESPPSLAPVLVWCHRASVLSVSFDRFGLLSRRQRAQRAVC